MRRRFCPRSLFIWGTSTLSQPPTTCTLFPRSPLSLAIDLSSAFLTSSIPVSHEEKDFTRVGAADPAVLRGLSSGFTGYEHSYNPKLSRRRRVVPAIHRGRDQPRDRDPSGHRSNRSSSGKLSHVPRARATQ